MPEINVGTAGTRCGDWPSSGPRNESVFHWPLSRTRSMTCRNSGPPRGRLGDRGCPMEGGARRPDRTTRPAERGPDELHRLWLLVISTVPTGEPRGLDGEGGPGSAPPAARYAAPRTDRTSLTACYLPPAARCLPPATSLTACYLPPATCRGSGPEARRDVPSRIEIETTRTARPPRWAPRSGRPG